MPASTLFTCAFDMRYITVFLFINIGKLPTGEPADTLGYICCIVEITWEAGVMIIFDYCMTLKTDFFTQHLSKYLRQKDQRLALALDEETQEWWQHITYTFKPSNSVEKSGLEQYKQSTKSTYDMAVQKTYQPGGISSGSNLGKQGDVENLLWH